MKLEKFIKENGGYIPVILPSKAVEDLKKLEGITDEQYQKLQDEEVVCIDGFWCIMAKNIKTTQLAEYSNNIRLLIKSK
jgi:hypothetical protein